MCPISKQQLLLSLQFSQTDSIYQVAQNPDIMGLILRELEPMWDYNKIVQEFKDPRFHRHATRLIKDMGEEKRSTVHPGRVLLRVIYPKAVRYWTAWIKRFRCENINLHGMIINTGKRWSDVDLSPW